MTVKKIIYGSILCCFLGFFVSLAMSQSAAPDETNPDKTPESVETVKKEAGETADAAAPDIKGERMKLRDIVKNGGKVMYVLAALSVFTVAFIVYFFIVLRVAQIAPAVLRKDIVEKVRQGDLNDVRRVCEYKSCPLSAVTLSAVDYLRDISEVDPVLMKDVVEGEGARQAEAIQGQTQYLYDIAVVAPMLGLLGTVLGMLKAFSTIAFDLAQAKPVNLANGVSQALITTAFGLIVGITAMIFYSFFRRKAARLISVLESASTDVLTAILGRKQNELS